MLKKLFITTLTMILFFVFVIPIYAETNIPQEIRIGLEYKYKNVDKIQVFNKNFLIGNEINGEFIPECILQVKNGFLFANSNEYYIAMSTIFDNYEKAKNQALELSANNNVAVPVYLDSKQWQVYIGGFSSIDLAKAKYSEICTRYTNKNFNIIVPNKRMIKIIDSSSKNIQDSLVILLNSSNTYPQFLPIEQTNNISLISMEDRKFRGRLEIGRYTSENLFAVNVLSLIEYLYGVVPSEMPSSWGIEALKAQAMAAKNYTLLSLNKHQGQGYDLCDNEHCQMYKGYTNEKSTTNKAINETKDVLLYYNDKLVQAFYSSSNGGYTEASENVWSAAIPYLIAKEDPYENDSKFSAWTKTFTSEDIKNFLAKQEKDIGDILDIQITKTSSSGSVLEMKIVGIKGEEIVKKDKVRSFFRPSGASLNSNKFVIQKTNVNTNTTPTINSNQNIVVVGNNNKATYDISNQNLFVIGKDTKKEITSGNLIVKGKEQNRTIQKTIQVQNNKPITFTLNGKGWGHGVGMSQYGAKFMAEKGKTYQEILNFYYTGAEVRKVR